MNWKSKDVNVFHMFAFALIALWIALGSSRFLVIWLALPRLSLSLFLCVWFVFHYFWVLLKFAWMDWGNRLSGNLLEHDLFSKDGIAAGAAFIRFTFTATSKVNLGLPNSVACQLTHIYRQIDPFSADSIVIDWRQQIFLLFQSDFQILNFNL